MENRQGIDADHRHMIRFSGVSDPGYRKIKNTLEGDILDIEREQQKVMEGDLQAFGGLGCNPRS